MQSAETLASGRSAAWPATVDVPVAWLVGVTIFGLGLLLRLPGIANTALTSLEAARAFEGYDVLRGQGVEAAVSPLLIYGQALLFLAFTPSDAAARFWPWLAGIALPLLPWLLRRQLGTAACGLTSLWLALSPTLGFFARYVGASELAMVGCLLLLALLYTERPLPVARPVLLGSVVGFTLACGPFGWLALALLLVALIVAPGAGRPGIGPARLGPLVSKEAGLAALVTLLLVTTGLLSRPGGFQEGLIDAPASLFGRALRAPAAGSWSTLPAVLIAYELVPTVLALFGLVAVGNRALGPAGVKPTGVAPLDSVASAWTILSLAVLAVLFRAELELAPLVIVPVCLLAGIAAGAVWADFAPLLRSLPALTLAGAIFFLLLVGGLVLNHVTNPAYPRWLPQLLVGIPFVLIALFTGLSWLWAGRGVTVGALAVVAALGLTLGTARASWTLNIVAPSNPSELLVQEASTGDLARLRRDLWTRYATVARGGRPSVAVAVAPELQPQLAWYLRDFETVRFEDPATSAAQIIVSPQPLPSLGLRPRIYLLTWAEATPGDPQTLPVRLWRWLAFREPGAGERGLLAYVFERR